MVYFCLFFYLTEKLKGKAHPIDYKHARNCVVYYQYKQSLAIRNILLIALFFKIMKEIIGKYLDAESCLSNLALEIFKYTNDNFPELIKNRSFYRSFIIYCDDFTVCYYYFDEESSSGKTGYIDIPLSRIYKNTWKEYIKSIAQINCPTSKTV